MGGYREQSQGNCPACKAEVGASAVEVRGSEAEVRCPSCDFTWTIDATDAEVAVTEAAAREAEAVEEDTPPPGVEVTEVGGTLVLRRRWMTVTTIVLGPAALIGLGVVAWALRLVSTSNAAISAVLLAAMVLLAFAAYVSLTGFTNRTHIVVDGTGIQVTHGPLPAFWVKRHFVPREDIEQLSVKTLRVYRSRAGAGTTSTRHRLAVSLRDGSEVALLTNLELAAQGLFIERRIEAHLGIEDA